MENTKYRGLVEKNQSQIKIKTSQGEFTCNYLVNAAGLYADKIAHDFGIGTEYEVLPFKGTYVQANPDFQNYKTLVYPIPDYSVHSFLGVHRVHITETPHGITKAGPTAIPCF